MFKYFIIFLLLGEISSCSKKDSKSIYKLSKKKKIAFVAICLLGIVGLGIYTKNKNSEALEAKMTSLINSTCDAEREGVKKSCEALVTLVKTEGYDSFSQKINKYLAVKSKYQMFYDFINKYNDEELCKVTENYNNLNDCYVTTENEKKYFYKELIFINTLIDIKITKKSIIDHVTKLLNSNREICDEIYGICDIHEASFILGHINTEIEILNDYIKIIKTITEGSNLTSENLASILNLAYKH